MAESLVDTQNRAALEAAQGIAFGGKPGIVIVVSGNGEHLQVAGLFGRDMKAEELRSALIGATIALGKLSEQVGNLGTVLEPEP